MRAEATSASGGAAASAGANKVPSGRRRDIQGLRAVAVGLVVAYHAGLPVPGGFIGVDMFFVISGFVISAMLMRQLEADGGLSFRTFYTRRLRRLLPALALLLVVVAIVSPLLLSPYGPQQATAKTGTAAALFSANLQLAAAPGGGYFGFATETNALLHTWSLSVEEQFYLVFPAFMVAFWRLGSRFRGRWNRPRTTLAAVSVATVASFVLALATSSSPPGSFARNLAFYSPFTRAWEFGVGVLLALTVVLWTRVSRRLGVPLGLVGAGLVAIGAFALSADTPFPGSAALLPVVGTALLIVSGMVPNPLSNGLSVRPAVWVGDVSYGWYLWHWPLIVFAAALWPGRTWVLVLAALVSLGPTWLSSRFVENPIRFNERLTGRRLLPLVAGCIAVPVVAFVGLFGVNRLELRMDSVQRANPHSDAPGCNTTTPLAGDGEANCTFTVAQPKGTVAVVGDSNAEQFVPPLANAANELGYDLVAGTRYGCPFVDMVDSASDEDCHEFVMDTLDALVAEKPELVIVANSASQVVENDGEILIDERTGEAAETPAEKARLWQQGLASVTSRLSDAGIPTVVVHTVPHFGAVMHDWTPDTCPMVRVLSGGCGKTLERAQVEQRQQRAKEAEELAIASLPGVSAIDVTDLLCSEDACTTELDGILIYRDATHVNRPGAMTLTDRFRDLIVQQTSS